jgi:exopolysaccharide production protein ExoZ
VVDRTRGYFSVVDQLRAVAALLVVYSHLVGNFLDGHARTWVPDTIVDELVRDPGHAMLNFGWPGVALFFFISGFVITHAASRETTIEFAVKRVLRIYPPLIATVLLVWLLTLAGVQSAGIPSVPPSPTEAFASMTLGNYLGWAAPALIVVGWTLAIEILFYVGLGIVRPLLATLPALVPVLLLGASTLVVLASTQAAAASPLTSVAASIAFVPLLVVGQITYLTFARRISLPIGALLGAIAWIAYIELLRITSPLFSDPAASFHSNAMLVFLVFLTAVLLEGRIAPLKVLSVISRRSYSLYLVHVPVGLTAVTVLVAQEKWPFGLGLLVGLLATAAATELSFRLIERPSLALARSASRRLHSLHRPKTLEPGPIQGSDETNTDDAAASSTDLRRQS